MFSFELRLFCLLLFEHAVSLNPNTGLKILKGFGTLGRSWNPDLMHRSQNRCKKKNPVPVPVLSNFKNIKAPFVFLEIFFEELVVTKNYYSQDLELHASYFISPLVPILGSVHQFRIPKTPQGADLTKKQYRTMFYLKFCLFF